MPMPMPLSLACVHTPGAEIVAEVADEVLEALEVGRFRRGDSVPLTAPAHGLVLQRVEYPADPFVT